MSRRNRVRRSAWTWPLLLGGALLLSGFAYLLLGETYIRPSLMLQALGGAAAAEHVVIVREFRLPRLVVGALAGAALSVAGALLQGVFRNPLAAPDLVGITGGAAAAAAAFLTFRPAEVSIHWLPAAAMAGAALLAAIVYAAAWRSGVEPGRLILVGIGIGALSSAFTSTILLLSSAYTATDAYIWLTGTVYGTSWQHVLTLLPWTVLFLLLALRSVRTLNVLMLSDESAAGVGSHVERSRRGLIAISVGLAGSAVAIGGSIGFVGLIGPHLARQLVGPSASRLLPTAALCGSLIVVLADLVARTAFLPYDVPVGVFTSAVGAPFFLYLLYRNRRTGR
ncbi:Iron(III) dicitrate transport system permease protein FecD [Paenibacillus pasadenensis]|uniref:Iron(III) dicitrate transport system permease protein FecD n=1 Tax=Paenibacillus pasadenensis TaxID=217090 RepID=A0A2N5N040_9BACL|nr:MULTISPECIES: iron ABC transporter permease [Paenibacillus]PLT43701.1 Iron(III) dicitrate transport system permease protein FecD [Paenibacillus pasadenensis]QGG54327.1 iron chelate uptake ABC transporter family permease subunit [Paenibacillus sp. B01]